MSDIVGRTSEASVAVYKSASAVFDALLREVRELSKKKPDATLSKSKVELINAILVDLLSILAGEPEGKYLRALEDEALPQSSDALLMMVQFDAALKGFKKRYYRRFGSGLEAEYHWMTSEFSQEIEPEDSED
jgi:hypothetical protein